MRLKSFAISLLITLLFPLTIIAKGTAASTDNAIPADSDTLNFVRASIVVTTPGDPIYSVFGHCALRMQCPSANLDYCFSLEMEPVAGNYIKYFSGKSKAEMVAVPTKEYLADYRQEGRGVTQYELNLTLPEKRLLWKNLDEDMMRGAYHDFNLINTNCVQASFMSIIDALITDSISYDKIPSLFKEKSGSRIKSYCKGSPWAEFLFMTISGAAVDGYSDIAYSLSPTTIIELLSHSRFVDMQTGKARPVFRNKPTILLPQTHTPEPHPLTPTVVFSILLAFVIIITIGEWKLGWKKIAKATDVTLFILQTLVGLLLIYMALSSNLFGSRWNWYLIPFNPLPAILWLFCRRKTWYTMTYLVYTVILVLFILCTPLSIQLDIPHALICATLAVRTGAHANIHRRNRIQRKQN